MALADLVSDNLRKVSILSFSQFFALFFLLLEKLKAFKRSADGFVKIPPGVYTHPFKVELSENLPTSCEGKYGFIRYLASVNIIRQLLPVATQTIAFTVIKPHNLNALPVYQVMIIILIER